MELQSNTRVFFDELSHTYILDGEKMLLGVTTLMKKHGLSPDYSGIPEATLMKAAAEGTAIHKEIEAYDNGLSVLRTPLIEEYVSLGLKFVCNEYLVSDNEFIASLIDGVYKGKKKNGFILVDYKTTQKVHKRSLAWQLGIYKVYFERQNPGKVVEECFCLHIDKKTRKVLGLIPIEPVTEAEVDGLVQAEKEGRIYIDNYDEPSAELVLTDEELAAYVTQQFQIADLKAQIKAIENSLEGLDKRVCDYMVEHNIETLEGGGGFFKLKKAYKRAGIDTARLKKMQPGIYEQYKKETTVAASVSFTKNN